MAWGIFKKVLFAPLRAIRSYINYKDKATTVKADALNEISDFVPKLKVIAPAIKVADNVRKKITDPVVEWMNKLNLN